MRRFILSSLSVRNESEDERPSLTVCGGEVYPGAARQEDDQVGLPLLEGQHDRSVSILVRNVPTVTVLLGGESRLTVNKKTV